MKYSVKYIPSVYVRVMVFVFALACNGRFQQPLYEKQYSTEHHLNMLLFSGPSRYTKDRREILATLSVLFLYKVKR